MADDTRRREQLRQSVTTYLDLIEEAKALIGGTVYTQQTWDLSTILDVLDPPSIDFNSIDGVSLRVLESMVSGCTSCRLSEGRTMTVFGEGSVPARLMVIGEGPGAEEDKSGRPFVGKAGEYLDTWLKAIHLERTAGVYLANIVKCRPPQNRDPQVDEREACLPYLRRQIQLVNPRMILLVGRTAAQTLLKTDEGLASLRGRYHRWEGIPTVVTYHPAAVLRNTETLRRPVWEDLKRVAAFLGIELGR